jgi:hypothetical protein
LVLRNQSLEIIADFIWFLLRMRSTSILNVDIVY